MNKVQPSNPVIKSEREDNHHYAVELADWKSRVRKQRQELYLQLFVDGTMILPLRSAFRFITFRELLAGKRKPKPC